MSEGTPRRSASAAVIGAGQMGAGIAQKLATEGFPVVVVDLDPDRVARGLRTIEATLGEGVARGVFGAEQSRTIRARIRGTCDWDELGEADLVVEAVFENLDIKQEVFRKLERHCRRDAILATNTSSFTVAEIAEPLDRPERAIGLHFFYHPAKNRLVEIVPTAATDPALLERARRLMERSGKTPIVSGDSPGFTVNRFFVPWLVEAVRLLDEGVADIPTIDASCRRTLGIARGPFELMNLTGLPVALHTATTLGEAFGALYAPPESLERQAEAGRPWATSGEPDPARFDEIERRMLGVVFHAAASVVGEGVTAAEDVDIGARVGLTWRAGPFEMINRRGIGAALELARAAAARHGAEPPALLAERAASGAPFELRLVRSATLDGIATLTIDRPDALNALNETVVQQLTDAFHRAASDPGVHGIVIAGTGKAFIAGADVRAFVRHIEEEATERIVEFTKAAHALLNAIDDCAKPVVARVHGLALGGGLEVALACDRIVATPRAELGFPETGLGIYPGLGGTQRTARRVGVGMAKALIFTGRRLDAEEAARMGLIDAVVPRERLDEAVREAIENGIADPPAAPTFDGDHAALARFFEHHSAEDLRTGRVDAQGSELLARAMKQVEGKAPIALRIAERLIDEGVERPLHEGLHMELEHLVEVFTTRDAYEGLSSLGKRLPRFRGH